MKVAVRVIGVLICLVLVASFVLEPSAPTMAGVLRDLPAPQVDTVEEEVVSSMTIAPQWTRATKVWTEAEMAAAIPYPVPQREGQAELLVSLAGDPEGAVVAAPLTFPAGLPEGEVGTMDDMSGLEAFPISGALAPGGYSYPAPFTRFNALSKQYYKEWPYKAIGKLFFVQYGVAYVCSAASIGGYAIWTAGHCVHAGDGRSDGWSYYTMFIPSYDNGKKKLGQWFGVNLWSLNGWINNGDPRYDMGGVILQRVKRKMISQKAGYLGFAYTPDAWGYAPQKHWFGIGYPQASPFTGGKQIVCASSYAYSDGNMGNPMPVGVGCDQTGGTSGGPWILDFGGGYYLNGNMSYRYIQPDHPAEMFSPYFGDAAYNLWYALLSSAP